MTFPGLPVAPDSTGTSLTAGDIVTETVAQLHGWGSTQDRVTALAQPVAPGDTTFTVTATFGQSTGISPGVVQIDSEQLYISGADPNSAICTVTPFGRGFNGTAAVAHAAGAAVISQPTFPRATVFKAVNEVLGSLFPQLFAIRQKTGLVVTYPNISYTVDTELQWLITAEWFDVSTSNWQRVLHWQVDPFDQSVRIADRLPIGAALRFMYATQPGLFNSEGDDFQGSTGLPISCYDVLMLGAVLKQTPGLDIARAQLTSVEQSARSTVVPPNAGLTVSKYVYGLYQERLANEAASLRRRFPPRIVRGF